MIHCTRCGRRMKHATATGLGPVCARAMLGCKPARVKRAVRSDDQPDLFEAENRVAQWFADAPSLEMST